jgi:hypothetical protein
VAIEGEGMLLQAKTPRRGDLVLSRFNALVEELLHSATIEAHEVVVVTPLIQFKD